jgi:hypothetical protein
LSRKAKRTVGTEQAVRSGARAPHAAGRAGSGPQPPESEDIATRVRRECAEQGLSEKVGDPAIIANVVTIAFDD